MEKSEGCNISSSEPWKNGSSFGLQPAPYICRWMNRHRPVPAAVVCLMRNCLLPALFRYVTQMIQNKLHSYLMRIKLHMCYVWMEVPCYAIPQVTWRWLGILQPKKICFYLCVVMLIYFMEQGPSWEANRFFSSSRNSPHFMEPEGSLPHSQVSATCPCPEPARSSPYSYIPLPEDQPCVWL
jgi:hypothetical protein